MKKSAKIEVESRWSFRDVASATGIDRRVLATAAARHGIVGAPRRGKSLDRKDVRRLARIFNFSPDFI